MNLLPTTFLALSALVAPLAETDLGRVGGPATDIERVDAGMTRVYHIVFEAGEPALVTVRGDGDTDLDLFIYDENGHLIAQDTDSTDHCLALWRPRWTGRFRIEVRNLGRVYNRYRLETN